LGNYQYTTGLRMGEPESPTIAGLVAINVHQMDDNNH
jgi:hypothetical protein